MSAPEHYGEQYEMSIEPSREWQEIECPACGHVFAELIQQGLGIASFCPECWARIRYVSERREGREGRDDSTEQETLGCVAADGGATEKTEQEDEHV